MIVITILGYELSQHAAVIYSLMNLCLYLYLTSEKQMLNVIDSISNNTLISLLYVIVTLHFFDKWLPAVLKFCIDVMAKTAYYFAYKSVRA